MVYYTHGRYRPTGASRIVGPRKKMFHITNFGSFSGGLSRYADLNSYIPEAGDDHDAMSWDSQTEWDDDSWNEFVDEAVAATEDAEKALAEWRKENA
jgi:hypothetical protein